MLRLSNPVSPSPAYKSPTGSNGIHEVKHDGYRLMAQRDPVGIRLITRRGNDWTTRFPLVVEAVNHLKVRSCLIDGEVVCCDERGLATFQLLRHRPNEPRAFLYAFDLLELNGTDLRREPIEVRKATLASILRKSRPGVRLNEHLEHSGGESSSSTPARWAGGDCLEAAGVALPIGAIDRLAQVQESGCTGGAARGRRGLVSLINTGAIGCVAFKAPSQSRSGFRSPAFASSMIFCAAAARRGSFPRLCWSATRVISYAIPKRRTVSASNLWPCK